MAYDKDHADTLTNHADHLQNDSRTCAPGDTGLTQPSSLDVLLKRNLAEQSKWLNDETGDRSWAVHPTQDIRWWMNVQVEALAKGN